MKEQINLQVSFNPRNESHATLLNWIGKQTTNNSSFIRETLFARMVGGFFGINKDISPNENIDQDEILRIIQV